MKKLLFTFVLNFIVILTACAPLRTGQSTAEVTTKPSSEVTAKPSIEVTAQATSVTVKPTSEVKKGFVDIGEKKYYFKDDGSMLIKGKIGDYYADYDGTLNYTLTGIADLDAEVGEIISEIIKDNMTENEKLWAVYTWPRDNTSYRAVNIEFPAGVIDTKEIYRMAQLMIENRKGSCEYYAAVSVVLYQRLGYKSRGIAGVYLDKLHAWSQVRIDGTYYNFDSGSVTWETEKGDRFFKKTNEELKKTHVKGLDNLPN